MINHVVLVGRMTKDADLRYTKSGKPVASIVLALDRRTKDADGKQECDFIPVIVWNKSAEAVANYTGKGSLVAVYGRIQVRNYEDKDKKKVYVTEVIADEVKFLSRKSEGSASAPADQEPSVTFDEDDIPF